MKNPEININILRFNIFTEKQHIGVALLNNSMLQADNIKKEFENIILKTNPEHQVKINKLAIDLGVIPFEDFAAQFKTRLIKAFIENIVRLSASSFGNIEFQHVADKAVEKALFFTSSHYPDCDIYPLACQCLHPTTLPQLMKTRKPNEVQRLLKQLVENTDNLQTASYLLKSTRITASQLSLTALSYLFNHEQGARWLSKNYPDNEQLRMWAEAIIHGEIRAEQVLHLLDLQNFPHLQQQSTIIHRWLLPLWQQPAIRNVISKRFGRDVIARIETYHKIVLSQASVSELRKPVSNAGLLLLWPLLPQLFTLLELYDGEKFISNEARWQAVNCLDWLVWEEEERTGGRFIVCQLLCGIPMDTPLPEHSPITRQQRRQIDIWLSAISQQLFAWEKLSLNDIRQLFLRRPGELIAESQPPQIIVQLESFDLLLRDWPWPMTLAILPWLNQPLTIIWPLNG